MFESYKVFVKIALVNEVSKGLLGLSGQFAQVGRDAEALQAKLNKLKSFALLGGGLAYGGFVGFESIGKALKPAEEYAHQLNIMNMAGLKHQEIAQATAVAWQTTTKVLTSTATGNLKTFLDLRNIFGNTQEAADYLPEIARIQAVLKASSESSVSTNADQLGFALAKALDMRGAVLNPKMFNEQAEMMSKVITATQGRVGPEDYRMLFKYSRQATMGLSNEFLYEELPTFMMEMKGLKGGASHGGFGTSLAAFNRLFVQGVMSKSTLMGMEGLGLIGPHSGLMTTTEGTVLLPGQHVRNIGLATTDPFQYVQKVIMPLIHKKYGDNLSNAQLNAIIAANFKGASSTALFALDQFAFKAQQVYRDQAIIRKAKDSKTAFAMAMTSDPYTVHAAFAAQWDNLKTAFGMSVIPVVLPALIKLTKELNEFAQFIRAHQTIAKDLTFAFAGLFAAMAIGGTVLLATAAFSGLAIVLSPIALTVAGVAAAITALTVAFTGLLALLHPYAAKHVTAAQVHAAQTNPHFFTHSALNPLNDPLIGQLMHPFASLTKTANANTNTSHGNNNTFPPITLQGNIFLDGHHVGNAIFGDSFAKSMNQQQLASPASFKLAQTPMTVGLTNPNAY